MNEKAEEAFSVLYSRYTKILKVNLTADSYEIVKSNSDEHIKDRGFSTKISEWLYDFARTGQVYPLDKDIFVSNTDINYLRTFFKKSESSYALRYRRKIGEDYRWVLMEMIQAPEYTDDDQIVFLYVSDIADRFILENEKAREIEHYSSHDVLTGLRNMFAYKTFALRYVESNRLCNVGVVYADLNRLKIINDIQGHEAGNQFILKFVDTLKKVFDDDSIYRISGDEFYIVMLDTEYENMLEQYQHLRTLSDSFDVPAASLGFCYMDNANDIDSVVALAEKEMYLDKEAFYEKYPEYKRAAVERNFNADMRMVISHLAQMYPTLAIGDLEKDKFRMLKFDDNVNFNTKGSSLTKYLRTFIETVLSEESKKNLAKLADIKVMRDLLSKNETLNYNFQTKDGSWRQVTFYATEYRAGVPIKIIFYASKLDKESADNLTSDLKMKTEFGILEGLMFEYNMIATIDAEYGKIHIYRNNKLPDSVVDIIKSGTYDEARQWFANTFIYSEDREEFIVNTSMSKVVREVREKNRYVYAFLTKPELNNGEDAATAMFFFYKVPNDEERIVFATKIM